MPANRIGFSSDFVLVNRNVGIGTTNPTQTLHVQGNVRITGGLYDSNNNVGTAGSVLSSTGSGLSWIATGGSVTVSDDTTTNATRYPIFEDVTSGSSTSINVSSTKLTFNPSTGTLSATQFTSLSDANKKKNIRPIENAIDITKKLEGVRFDWIDSDTPSIGVIAQETLGLKERTDAIDKLFLTNLDDTPATAWGGHRQFAENLVRFLNPKVIVDLGVDWGYSTFSFALPRIGHTYGIDNFVGDDFVGTDELRKKYNFVTMKREKLHLQNNLTLIEGDFNEVAQTWDKTIDILHIDGSHKYEDIKRDFETWSKFVTDNGIILLHDTCIESLNGNDYGVKKFFDELDMPKFTFTHCFGLGVICKNDVVLYHIKNNFT